MSIQSHYERDDAHSGALVAAKWRAIWLEVQTDMGCCTESTPTKIINYDIRNTNIKLLMFQLRQLYFDASLDVTVAFPLAPANFDTDPGDAGDEIADRERALCLAAESFVDELMNAGMQWLEVAARDIIPVATGALVLPSVPTLVVTTIGITLLVFGASAYIQMAHEGYRDYLACAMFEELKGEAITSKAAFDAVFDNLPSPRPQPETPEVDVTRDLIEKWARSQVNNLDNYLAFVSNLDSAMNIASTLTDEDCECSGVWEHSWLGGFNESGDWDFVEFNPGYALTTYNAAEDRAEGTCVEDATVGAKLEITLVATTITQIRFDAAWLSTRVTSANESQVWVNDDFPNRYELAHGTGEGSHLMDTGPISISCTSIILRSAAGCNDCGLSDYAYIGKITINGTGANPFL